MTLLGRFGHRGGGRRRFRSPRWTRHDVSDPGITLLELLAFLGDALSDYQDAVARERRARTRRVVVAVAAVVVSGAWMLKRAGAKPG